MVYQGHPKYIEFNKERSILTSWILNLQGPTSIHSGVSDLTGNLHRVRLLLINSWCNQEHDDVLGQRCEDVRAPRRNQHNIGIQDVEETTSGFSSLHLHPFTIGNCQAFGHPVLGKPKWVQVVHQ